MPNILALSSSFVTLKFSVHNFFETRVLLKIFDTEFPCKLSYFDPLCLPAKMAAKTVTRSIYVEIGAVDRHFANFRIKKQAKYGLCCNHGVYSCFSAIKEGQILEAWATDHHRKYSQFPH